MKTNMLKIKDITPIEHYCIIGSCPTIVETDKDSYIIIGNIVSKEILDEIDLSRKVGKNEMAIEIPKSLLSKVNR